MCPVEVIQLLEVNRGRRGSQVVDAEALNHLIECHHVIFRDTPAHERDPVQNAFRDITKLLHIA